MEAAVAIVDLRLAGFKALRPSLRPAEQFSLFSLWRYTCSLKGSCFGSLEKSYGV